VIIASHGGNERDVALILEARSDPDPSVRSAALGALQRQGVLSDEMIVDALSDPEPLVRQRAARIAGSTQGPASAVVQEGLTTMLSDPIPLCVISALSALGALGVQACGEEISSLALQHKDPLVVEEAIATLAELGDPMSLPVILSKVDGKPALRRRVVAALGAFEGPEVESALDRLSEDRDWQVRQAVAMLRRQDLDDDLYRSED
jgi:HEAT repeat protein